MGIRDRPNIVLVGENRDSTRIVLAETAQTRAITEYHGRPVGNGAVSYTHLDVYKRQGYRHSLKLWDEYIPLQGRK